LTVMPSQNKLCYRKHANFPNEIPADWWSWIAIGLKPAMHGGCNDLIVSGHSTVLSTLACVVASVSRTVLRSTVDRGSQNENAKQTVSTDTTIGSISRSKDRHAITVSYSSAGVLFACMVWWNVIIDYAIEVYEGFHYSVDMWLGLVLVSLTWRVFRWIEEVETSTLSLDVIEEKNKLLQSNGSMGEINTLTTTTEQPQCTMWFYSCAYGSPALLAYLQLIAFPSYTSNPMIIVYAIWSSAAFLQSVRHMPLFGLTWSRHEYQHYAQHVMVCLLYMALGIYL
jgi:hypothetical protein